ncbi:MAG: SH3 domain-containing protein, partial [Myxococcota bacterium]
RKFAVTSTRMVLRERPQEGAAPRRVLPAEARILPLRRTPDGVWVEVRDDRGDVGWVTSEGLPKLSPELPVAPGGEGPTVTALALETDATPGRSDDAEASSDSLLVTAERPPSHRQLGGDGLHLTAAAFGGVVLPSQQLDSDAVSGERRYELSSMSAGLGLEIQVTDLGPIAVRLGGLFGTLEGLEPEAGGGSAGGTTLSLDFRAGWPLRLGALTLAPEVGYAYDDLSLDLALPGARTATFVSTSGHSGLVGLRVQYAFGSFLFEGEGAFSLGAVSPRPASLGTEAGLALGGRGAVDVHYLFDARFGLVARYTVDGRSVGFSGASTLDATISEAEVSELRQAILLGATYSLF